MAVDNSTLPVSTTVTGTGWTVNVSACKLDTSTGVKDFQVTSGSVVLDITLFNKTSSTSITYTGVSLPASTPITVTRKTPITRIAELTGYGSKISTLSYEGEINRLHRLAAEYAARLSSLESGGGVGGSPVVDTAYSTAWNSSGALAPSQNAVYDIIQSIAPAGMVVPFATTTMPFGWLECNGQTVNRTTYSKLFALIGVTYGAGDGSTTFALPDFGGRVIAHREASNLFNTTAGANSIAYVIPQHNHVFTTTADGVHSHAVGGTGGNFIVERAASTFNFAGGGGAFYDRQPTTNNSVSHTHTGTTNNTGTLSPSFDPRQRTHYLCMGISTGLQ